MENVNFTIFLEGAVVFLLVSIGVLQTPRPEGLVFRRHLAMSRVTRNRRHSDALTLGGPYGTFECFGYDKPAAL